MVDCLLFYVPLENLSLIWRRRHYRWMATTCRFIQYSALLGFQQELILACYTCCDMGPSFFSYLIRRTAPFSCLLWHASGCRGPVLIQIFTGFLWYWLKLHSTRTLNRCLQDHFLKSRYYWYLHVHWPSVETPGSAIPCPSPKSGVYAVSAFAHPIRLTTYFLQEYNAHALS
jgi:hypothetical protein